MSDLEKKLDLQLRGIHLLLRATFAPNDEARRMQHVIGLQNDIGPWFKDYVDALTPSAEDTAA